MASGTKERQGLRTKLFVSYLLLSQQFRREGGLTQLQQVVDEFTKHLPARTGLEGDLHTQVVLRSRLLRFSPPLRVELRAGKVPGVTDVDLFLDRVRMIALLELFHRVRHVFAILPRRGGGKALSSHTDERAEDGAVVVARRINLDDQLAVRFQAVFFDVRDVANLDLGLLVALRRRRWTQGRDGRGDGGVESLGGQGPDGDRRRADLYRCGRGLREAVGNGGALANAKVGRGGAGTADGRVRVRRAPVLCDGDGLGRQRGIGTTRAVVDTSGEQRQGFGRGALRADTALLFDALIGVLVLLVTVHCWWRGGRWRRSRRCS